MGKRANAQANWQATNTPNKTPSRSQRQDNMGRILRPATIAFIGGSQVAGSIRACKEAGYEGDIWVVNPTREFLEGIPCVPSISDLPAVPDAALIGLSPQRSIEAVHQLASMGAGGAVVMSGGFKELGGEGERLQNELQSVAADMAILGPNCMGILNQFEGAAIWGEDNHMESVKGEGCAIISQSGAFIFGITNVEQAFPLGYAISTGNQAVTDMADCVEAVLKDKRVKAIGLYLEGLDDGEPLGHACWKALKQNIPVVALKGGDSPAAEAVAISHTAAMVVERDLWNAFCDRYGIAEVSTPKALVETLKLLTIGGIPKGNCVSAVSFSGGLNGLFAKHADQLDLVLPTPSPENTSKLRALLPESVPISNPLDLNIPFKSKTGLSMENGDKVAEGIAMLASDVSDQLIFFIDVPRPDERRLDAAWLPILEAMSNVRKTLNKPCSVAGILPEGLDASLRRRLLAEGVVPLLGFGEAMEALKVSTTLAEKREKISFEDKPADLLPLSKQERAVMLDEAHSKYALKEFGLETPEFAVSTIVDAPSVATQLGYPVAIKVLSTKIAHKARIGGVYLNVQTPDEVTAALKQMVCDVEASTEGHRVTEVLVEKMVPEAVREFIIGVKRHDALGLALMIGLGGSDVESQKTYTSLLLPLQEQELTNTLTTFNLSKDSPAFLSLTKAARSVAAFAQRNHDTLVTLDVNPVMLTQNGECIATDALIVISQQGETE